VQTGIEEGWICSGSGCFRNNALFIGEGKGLGLPVNSRGAAWKSAEQKHLKVGMVVIWDD